MRLLFELGALVRTNGDGKLKGAYSREQNLQTRTV